LTNKIRSILVIVSTQVETYFYQNVSITNNYRLSLTSIEGNTRLWYSYRTYCFFV